MRRGQAEPLCLGRQDKTSNARGCIPVYQRRLERLPERERLIVERRFGLQGEPQTLETVGRELGLTRERVRQLQVQALKQLETELADLAPMQTAAARAAHARKAERVPA